MKNSKFLMILLSLLLAVAVFSPLFICNSPQIHEKVIVNADQNVVNSIRTPYAYNVVFHEYGLPSGMSWSITIDKTTYTTQNTTLTFILSNGTYPYSIKSIEGYYSPSDSTVTVSGSGKNITLTFQAINSPSETLQLFLEGLGFGGIIGGLIVSSVNRRRNK